MRFPLTADPEGRVTTRRFGGAPDRQQCGGIASAVPKAVGDYRLLGFAPPRPHYNASDTFGGTAAGAFAGAAR
jgi:hypothetical protein